MVRCGWRSDEVPGGGRHGEGFKHMTDVLLERFGKVARLTLNRPERLNAINESLRSALEGHMRDIAADDDISVVVIRGAGRAFCSGYDLKELPGKSAAVANGYAGKVSISKDRERLRQTVERLMWLWAFPKPTIAEVHGYCLGGGGELAAMCDLTICSDDAQFGHPAARAVGIPPTLALWPMKIGMSRTKELLFTGDMVSGAKAAEIGIATHCVPRDQLEQHVLDLAQRIAMIPLDALTIHKQVTNRWFEIMGVRTCLAEGIEFDAIFHQTSVALEFAEKVQNEGLATALAERDGPFGTRSRSPSN